MRETKQQFLIETLTWVTIPDTISLPDNQQERDMIARELLIKFQMSENHPMVDLNNAYRKF